MLLAGDIGGTKTVLALFSPEVGPRHPLKKEIFSSKRYPSLEAIIAEFLEYRREDVTHAAFGVAGPVVKDRAQITNLPWLLDEQHLASTFNLEAVHLLNDLEAVATAVPILQDEDIHTLNEGETDPHGSIGVIAPGTGLGEAFLVWYGEHYHAFPSEGGHADFAPTDETQIALLRYLQQRHRHVSYERVCSGIGIPNLYAFFQESGQYPEPAWLREQVTAIDDPTPLIVHAAQEEQAAIATATLNLFISILAREAGNLALKILATGGIYLGGGIPPRILPQLQASNFTTIFTRKGRFSDLLERIPVHVICNSQAALLGTAHDGLNMIQAGRHHD